MLFLPRLDLHTLTVASVQTLAINGIVSFLPTLLSMKAYHSLDHNCVRGSRAGLHSATLDDARKLGYSACLSPSINMTLGSIGP